MLEPLDPVDPVGSRWIQLAEEKMQSSLEEDFGVVIGRIDPHDVANTDCDVIGSGLY